MNHQPALSPEKALEQQVNTLLELSSITLDLSHTLKVDKILQKMVEATMEICEAEAASILLLDESGNHLYFYKVVGEKCQEISNLKRPITQKSIAGWVVTNKVPLIVNDVTKNSKHCKDVDRCVGFTTRSILGIPVMWRDEIFGVIEAVNKIDESGFTERDKQYLSIMASQAAIALKNARLVMDLKAAQDKIIQAEKLAMTGILASSVTHNIKGIVSIIRAPFFLLSKEKKLGEKTTKLIDMAEEGVERLMLITKKMNSFSRPTELEIRGVNINEIIESLLLIVEKEAAHRKSVIIKQLKDGLPQVQADPGRMEQVFVNIFINAFEAMQPEGGKLTISTKQKNNSVVIKFADTGPGIPEEILNKLFKPFFTTKAEGTGLGLFSCKQIIENELGGKIEIESKPGKGAVITIVLASC